MRRNRLRIAACDAFGQHVDVRLDHSAGRLQIADLNAPAQRALHVAAAARFRTLRIALAFDGLTPTRAKRMDGIA
ncbi:hypothetical protein BSFP_042850 [Burkholderia stabilis]|uniref:Uncharacterized protein n=1 Tax=Burkholderia stabilis TaxID=95485 RepID=A0A1Y1BSY9_9BURK|nr:hypothetical protein BSFP_042850 [Burkholderia stabilis]